MEIRKLSKEEHIRTRKLWEEIFQEATPKFLDYYYSVKTKENEIYVIEEEGNIVSMVHLNPYEMRIKDRVYTTHYIVAVATDPKYRRQGLMARLLHHVMQVMADRGEPFTFLMPASEAIYKPFGFEFVYEQRQGKVKGSTPTNQRIQYVLAEMKDCKQIADFANEQLKQYDITTWRTAEYYEMILAEQISENGGILLAMQGQTLVGVFCFGKEEQVELREPLFVEEGILEGAIYHLIGNEEEPVSCSGYGTETKPMIMAKVLQPGWTEYFKNQKVFINEVV